MKLTMNDKQREELIEYAEKTAESLKQSAICLSLFTDDYKKGIDSLLQFGLSLMFDKPIYLIVPHGVAIPEKIKLIADGIEYFNAGDIESAKIAANKLLLLALEREKIPKERIQ